MDISAAPIRLGSGPTPNGPAAASGAAACEQASQADGRASRTVLRCTSYFRTKAQIDSPSIRESRRTTAKTLTSNFPRIGGSSPLKHAEIA
ncbi:hypothetical protein Stube_04510 [Streptomyces tubercidicus]|uniref:Uncharacterized protein n=1 Tax=Streptomyces tubercidicus TaxID=47759 RepID=A0A640UIA0_9ACTN|nr:hypothetical protein Stube_04510 [Streptomyces tubercidicus]